jgi:hypothetical protein
MEDRGNLVLGPAGVGEGASELGFLLFRIVEWKFVLFYQAVEPGPATGAKKYQADHNVDLIDGFLGVASRKAGGQVDLLDPFIGLALKLLEERSKLGIELLQIEGFQVRARHHELDVVHPRLDDGKAQHAAQFGIRMHFDGDAGTDAVVVIGQLFEEVGSPAGATEHFVAELLEAPDLGSRRGAIGRGDDEAASTAGTAPPPPPVAV